MKLLLILHAASIIHISPQTRSAADLGSTSTCYFCWAWSGALAALHLLRRRACSRTELKRSPSSRSLHPLSPLCFNLLPCIHKSLDFPPDVNSIRMQAMPCHAHDPPRQRSGHRGLRRSHSNSRDKECVRAGTPIFFASSLLSSPPLSSSPATLWTSSIPVSQRRGSVWGSSTHIQRHGMAPFILFLPHSYREHFEPE